MHLIDTLLRHAWLYNLSQWLWYRPGRQEFYVRHWIRPHAGDRILDIGCGTALLWDFMRDVHYHGVDPNERYVRHARKRTGLRGDFTCGYLTELPPEMHEHFDIVLANGVLHHMSNKQADEMLSLARKALKPGGRLITRDGCFEPGQSAFVRFLLESDRGQFVRTRPEYESLIKRHFESVRTDIQHEMLRVPYALLLSEATKSQINISSNS